MNVQKIIAWAIETNHVVSGADFVARKKEVIAAYQAAHPSAAPTKRSRAEFTIRKMVLASPEGEELLALDGAALGDVKASSRGWEVAGPATTAVLLGAAFLPEGSDDPVELPDDTVVYFEREARRTATGSYSEVFGFKPKTIEVVVEQYVTDLGRCRAALESND